MNTSTGVTQSHKNVFQGLWSDPISFFAIVFRIMMNHVKAMYYHKDYNVQYDIVDAVANFS